ncbi:MAG: ATP-binding cassette domain-containing protein, partial [Sphingobacteriaceae bacterium]|nr:ATP-binding cassette domain-containing protein [Cytophagaceae bacterium]
MVCCPFPLTKLLSLQNATLRRFDTVVLRNLTWTLKTGQHWAVLGENGSGKSTFLETLAGKIPVVSGIFEYPVGPLREVVELVPKDFSFDRIVASSAQFYQQRFNAHAAETAPTAREVLQGQLRPVGTVDVASVTIPPARYDESWLAEVADRVQISPLLDRRLTSLSNGETRRTLLARSLLKRPKILLLDNPFAGLDTASRARLHDTLDRISRTVTLVLVTTPDEIPACVTNVFTLHPERGAASVAAPPREVFPEPVVEFTHALRMRNVSVRYGEVEVLKKINWEVKRGEKWAVLGPNGSGKSTLLSLLTADNPQGYANDFDLFDKKRGSGESIWDIKSRIGFVSPELHLYFPRETLVWKVVASGLFDTAGLFRRLNEEQAGRVEAMLDFLKIKNLREKRLGQLSSGQQRWVLLARALVKNPALLILDEPGQGLDPEHVTRFRELVDNICQN